MKRKQEECYSNTRLIAKGNHQTIWKDFSREKPHIQICCERYLETIEGKGSSIKKITFLNYKNQLLNQAVPRIGGYKTQRP